MSDQDKPLTDDEKFAKAQREIAELSKKPGSFVSERTTPISKVKQPLNKEDYYEISNRFGFWPMQLAGDDAAYYYCHMPQFMNQQLIMPRESVAVLERDINPAIGDLTFTKKDGSQTVPLKEFLAGPARKQAMMMAHKGKVVFEEFPGMNPNDLHIWMSAGKTPLSLVFTQIVAEGKVKMEDMCSKYVPELQGTVWDDIPVWTAATMCVGLDIEETFKSVLMPGSWINNFHSTFLGLYDVPYMKQLQTAKRLPNGEQPGGPGTMRYSSADTLLLQFICEQVENQPFGVILQERVWSKVGFRIPACLCLAPDGTGVGYGMFSTTPEDMLRFAMLYTPSWNKVADEPIVTDKMMELFHKTGRPEAFAGTEEQQMATQWFGEAPPANGIQWDNIFEDGAMFKHGNNGQGIYVDPKRDFCAMGFGVAANTSGVDYAPGFMRAAAKHLVGE
jgi:CubicO group peptidase (beta-lactamase class C family)